jgi:hypothetical protein
MENILRVIKDKGLIIIPILLFLLISVNSCKNSKINRINKKYQKLQEQNDSLISLIPSEDYERKIRNEAMLDLLIHINNDISRETRTPQMMRFHEHIISKIEDVKKLQSLK